MKCVVECYYYGSYATNNSLCGRNIRQDKSIMIISFSKIKYCYYVCNYIRCIYVFIDVHVYLMHLCMFPNII